MRQFWAFLIISLLSSAPVWADPEPGPSPTIEPGIGGSGGLTPDLVPTVTLPAAPAGAGQQSKPSGAGAQFTSETTEVDFDLIEAIAAVLRKEKNVFLTKVENDAGIAGQMEQASIDRFHDGARVVQDGLYGLADTPPEGATVIRSKDSITVSIPIEKWDDGFDFLNDRLFKPLNLKTPHVTDLAFVMLFPGETRVKRETVERVAAPLLPIVAYQMAKKNKVKVGRKFRLIKRRGDEGFELEIKARIERMGLDFNPSGSTTLSGGYQFAPGKHILLQAAMEQMNKDLKPKTWAVATVQSGNIAIEGRVYHEPNIGAAGNPFSPKDPSDPLAEGQPELYYSRGAGLAVNVGTVRTNGMIREVRTVKGSDIESEMNIGKTWQTSKVTELRAHVGGRKDLLSVSPEKPYRASIGGGILTTINSDIVINTGAQISARPGCFPEITVSSAVSELHNAISFALDARFDTELGTGRIDALARIDMIRSQANSYREHIKVLGYTLREDLARAQKHARTLNQLLLDQAHGTNLQEKIKREQLWLGSARLGLQRKLRDIDLSTHYLTRIGTHVPVGALNPEILEQARSESRKETFGAELLTYGTVKDSGAEQAVDMIIQDARQQLAEKEKSRK